MNRWIATVIVVAATAGGSYWLGRRRGQQAPTTREIVAEPPRATARRVRMPAALAERSGVRVVQASRRMLSPSIELLGSIDFDADRVADVGGRIAGRVTRIFVSPGSDVRQGEPLAQIESAALGEAIAQYLSAHANLIAARANANRETGLAGQNLSTAVALEQARARAQALTAEVRGAEQRLLAMGATSTDIRSVGQGTRERSITLRAPIAGRVITRHAVLGQVVEPTSTVVRIADLRELWVQLDVFERDLARVRPGNSAEIMSETYPNRIFRGTVNYVDATLDMRTRTSRVRIEVDNADLLLRPGQFVTARVSTEGSVRPIVAIPRGSIVQVEGRPSAFVRVDAETYELRNLELGVTEGDTIEVARGIDDGEIVVSEGAFAIKSELQR